MHAMRVLVALAAIASVANAFVLLPHAGFVPAATPVLRRSALVSPRSGAARFAASSPVVPLLRAGRAGLALRMAGASEAVIDVEGERVAVPQGPKIPITLLSGFLGSGKTTLLREMLQNKGGLKVGVIVNDIAAVNIDAKLIISDGQKQKSVEIGGELIDTSDVMQLENGCACCSASDELLESLLKLLVVAAEKGEMYDRVIIESSGVSEPKNVRQTFFMMAAQQHPAFDYATLQNMVTVVDAGNFLNMYQSGASLEMRPDLVEEDSLETNANRRVVELLTEQIEVADYILLNKADMVDAPTMTRLQTVVKALNPGAEVSACSFGKVGADIVLGSKRKSWVAERDDEDDFRASASAVVAPAPGTRAAAEKEALAAEKCVDTECKDESHGHSHSAVAKEEECKDTECKDESHGHSHGAVAKVEECAEPECKDESHGHSHAKAEVACVEEACTDPSHAHSHAKAEVACADETCTDPSHSHGDSHAHTHEKTPEEKWGISSFVYFRRRPFSPARLKKAILQLPISGNSEATEGDWKVLSDPGSATAVDKASPLHRVIRSKGFVWLANNHRDPLYWSHAGQFFDLKDFGMFWAATPAEWWPSDAQSLNQIGADWGGATGEFGDRRQEVVFIGLDLDQEGISKIMDDCLATDEEMEEYKKLAGMKPDRVSLDFSTTPPTPIDLENKNREPRTQGRRV
mmetsp:Transcript_55068/g.131109  ORF Transcript_55068/g.131109 Transcript_55068/m.131109 type:complete len:692 (-) Transcript_55068:135-2210(-)|eukprot:CAMPEP_0180129252 /NCGR_PEP_ID=MMETSP0986-20121125/7215_1 /TAXON_ID=697907 /ORGANISM="non described non described, Strain CCMP2293" /LENGTH=691 /DNA_ID=CAMNT_0022068905 /DNA_START=53 /DNA_END=2128 /DNA_ORIENTATION=+